MKMNRNFRFVALAGLVWAAGGCGRFLSSGDELDPVGPGEITLEVQNDNYNDATLHARSGTYQLRLGRVTGNGSETFTFRWEPVDLQVQIVLLALGSYFTDRMDVQVGDVIDLVIQPGLERRPGFHRRRRGQ